MRNVTSCKEIEEVPESNQIPADEHQAGEKKAWQTPKLSMLDIKATTLGGTTVSTVEDLKNMPS